MTHKKVVTTEEVLEQLPCIKCGYNDKLSYWGDKHYGTQTVTCPKCNSKYSKNLGWDANHAEVIEKICNPANDRMIKIDKLEKEILELPNIKKRLRAIVKGLLSGKTLNDIEGK